MICMIPHQNHGVYTTAAPEVMPRTMDLATAVGVAHRGPFLSKAAVIGVSTKPGLIVTTVTPFLCKRWRSPLVKAVTAAFAEPYT